MTQWMVSLVNVWMRVKVRSEIEIEMGAVMPVECCLQ